MSDLRIVSLIASSTEILFALGLGDKIVGRSHECDFPEAVLKLPVCTTPSINTETTSLNIDRQIRDLLEKSLSIYKTDLDMLAKLAPTHIVTQSQCQVCAVSLKDVEDALCQIGNLHPQVISLEPNCLEDIWQDILRIGQALSVESEARALVSNLHNRIDATANKAESLSDKPRVCALEWIDPLMSAGNWVPELAELAGGINLFGEKGVHSPELKWESVLQADPDLIICLPCGFDIARCLQDTPTLFDKPNFGNLKASRDGKVFVVDGNQFFNRPGPRLVESLEILAEIFHPGQFDFGHRGKNWVKYFDAHA